MSDAFRETNTVFFKQNIIFNTGFSVLADAAWNIGGPSTTGSFLNTYNKIRPYGGISGYLQSGEASNSFDNLTVNNTGFIKNIIGGTGNNINNSLLSFIGGGSGHTITTSKYSAILGGTGNQIIGDGSLDSNNFIFGNNNIIHNENSSVIVGANNILSGNVSYSFALGTFITGTNGYSINLGHYIRNDENGAMVLADSRNVTKTPKTSESLTINFLNGVYITGSSLEVEQTGVFKSALILPSSPPASSGAAGSKGSITFDSNYIYICVAQNQWKRIELTGVNF